MNATTMIIRGSHNGKPATVTFVRISAKIWNATVESDGKRVDIRSFKNNELRPCPTHAGHLLDEHFPSVRRRVSGAKTDRQVRMAAAQERRARRVNQRGLTVFDGDCA